MSELVTKSAIELRDLVASGEASAVEVTRAHLERIHATDDQVGAFLRVLDDAALAHAQDIDRRRASGEPLGPLAGVPVAVKDIFATWLEQHFPDRKEKVLNRIRSMRGGKLNDSNFDSRMRGDGVFAEHLEAMFKLAVRRAGLEGRSFELRKDLYRRPEAQFGLFE